MANKSGSDGQIRKTTAEWATDTDTYLEGMRLMDTTTGEVRVSKGTTYALAWVPATGGGASAWGGITGTLSDQTDLQSALNEKIEIADIAPTATFSTTTNTAQDPGQDTVRFNSGTIASVTEIALSDVVGGVDKGDLNSRFSGIIQFRPVGTTDTIEFQITSVVHTSWTRYTVTYLKGTLPANGTVMAVRFLPSNTVNVATTAALATKQNRTRVVTVLTAIDATRNLDGTEDIIVATGVSPTAVFDPGTLPVGFILEIRNDASQPCAFNPDTGSIISIPAGGSAILRQKAAGTWVDLLAAKADISSPTFTDEPSAPTPAANDNTTQLATTAYVQGELLALSTVADNRTGSAILFDVPAEYNTAASPSSGTVTADYTGAVSGTQVLCWFNHGAQPSWPSGWTVVGPWNASAANAVLLTYRSGTTVSGLVVSSASGTPSNPESIYYATSDFAVTSATPAQVAGISGITIKAGKLYAVDIILRGTCSGTSGGYLGFYASTGTDHIVRMAGRTDSADNLVFFAPGANGGYNSTATTYPIFAATSPTNLVRLSGTIRGGAADATFEMRGRSVNAAQTFTIYADGSYCRVTQMN